jgi:DNA-binding response OmpR family regulator
MTEILVVEDDNDIAQLLTFLLEREGYRVTHLADGEVAHQRITSAGPRPALVLLDAMLPYRDGLSLVAEIRRNARWSGVQIIMLTARSLERDIVQALESGVSDYVVKPFQPQELLARVRRLVRANAA